MTGKHVAVGAYIYAGGFTVGMLEYLDVIAHLEDGDFGVETVHRNLPSVATYTNPTTWPLAMIKSRGCRVCFANPPCAPWSMAGRGGRVSLSDPRVTSHKNSLRLLDEIEPDVWAWESVTQAYLGKHDELSQHVTEYGMERGYSVYHFLHDAKFMGLPQQRRRVLTILSRVRIDFEPPDHPIVTIAEALQSVQDPGNITPLSKKYADYVPLVKPGQSLREVYLQYNDPPGPKWLDHRPIPDRPSSTQIGSDHILHPFEDRFLGINEVARICGYPDGYVFDPDAGYPVAQAARAVTPPVGRYLGRTLASALDRGDYFTTPEEWEINYMGVSNRIADTRMKREVKRLR